MNEQESIEHIEMFVHNKVREGYGGLFPKRSAKNNVFQSWGIYKDKGANLEAVSLLGADRVDGLLQSTTEKVLSSKEELQKVLSGDYRGSSEDLLNELWKD